MSFYFTFFFSFLFFSEVHFPPISLVQSITGCIDSFDECIIGGVGVVRRDQIMSSNCSRQ